MKELIFMYKLPVELRVLICIEAIYELGAVRMGFLLHFEHKKGWEAEDRREDEAEKYSCGMMVLGAKSQASMWMSE
jgi:hypothetical protein